jgi:hypothetical protein
LNADGSLDSTFKAEFPNPVGSLLDGITVIILQPDGNILVTNTLVGGSSFFADPEGTNSPRRFYRLRSL